MIDISVRIRDSLIAFDFGDGVLHVVAPLRKVHKHSAAVGDRNTGWHRSGKSRNYFELPDHMLAGEFLGDAVREQTAENQNVDWRSDQLTLQYPLQ